jgi:hypothetical protein
VTRERPSNPRDTRLVRRALSVLVGFCGAACGVQEGAPPDEPPPPVLEEPADEPTGPPHLPSLDLFQDSTCFQTSRGLDRSVSVDEIARTNIEYCTTVCHDFDTLVDAFEAERDRITRVDHDTFITTTGGCRAVEATHATIERQWSLSETGMFPQPGWLATWAPGDWSRYEDYVGPEGLEQGPLVVHGIEHLVVPSACNETVYLISDGASGARLFNTASYPNGPFDPSRPEDAWGQTLCRAIALGYVAARLPPASLDHAPTVETSCWTTGDLDGPLEDVVLAVQIHLNYTRIPGGKMMMIDEVLRVAAQLEVDITEEEIVEEAERRCTEADIGG